MQVVNRVYKRFSTAYLMNLVDIDKKNGFLRDMNADYIVKWANGRFPTGLVMTSSFGKYSAVMINIVTRVMPDISVIYVKHPYIDEFSNGNAEFVLSLRRRYHLNFHQFDSLAPRRPIADIDSAINNEDNLELKRLAKEYKYDYKIEPLERALKELNVLAWFSGIMSWETGKRKENNILSRKENCIYKIHPIFYWTENEVLDYVRRNNLPINRHYFDIFKGREQNKECGLHLTKEQAESLDSSGL